MVSMLYKHPSKCVELKGHSHKINYRFFRSDQNDYIKKNLSNIFYKANYTF